MEQSGSKFRKSRFRLGDPRFRGFNSILCKASPSSQDESLAKLDVWIAGRNQEIDQGDLSDDDLEALIRKCLKAIFKQTEALESVLGLMFNVHEHLFDAFPEKVRPLTRDAFWERVTNVSDSDLPIPSKQFRYRQAVRFCAWSVATERNHQEFLNAILLSIAYTCIHDHCVTLLRRTVITLTESIVELILGYTWENMDSQQGVAGMLQGCLDKDYKIVDANFDELIQLYFAAHSPGTYVCVHTIPLWNDMQALEDG